MCVKNKNIIEKMLKYQCIYNKSHKMIDSMTEKYNFKTEVI